VAQFGLNTEQSIHILALPSLVYFKTEFVLQESHNELTQVKQLVILVQITQLIYIDDTNPYYVDEIQLKH
jgi:hypothetical protein